MAFLLATPGKFLTAELTTDVHRAVVRLKNLGKPAGVETCV